MIRIVVLVSGRGSNLEALLNAIDAGRCRASVGAVLSDRTAPALEAAAARGVSTKVVPFRRGDRSGWSADLADAAQEFSPDIVVLAGFMRILAPSFIARFPRRILNVHPSLLPAFPGAHAPERALASGARITGCTVHLVDEGVDTGPILAQAAVPIAEEDDVASLHERIRRAEHRLLPAVVGAVAAGTLDLETGAWTRTPWPDRLLFVPELE